MRQLTYEQRSTFVIACALASLATACTSHTTLSLDDGVRPDAGRDSGAPARAAEDQDDRPPQVFPNPVTGSAGAFGGAGTAGFGPMPGTTPDAGTPTQVRVPCGPNVCASPMPLPIPITIPMPCCVDATTGTCGTASNGVCMPPPPPDPRCPQVATGLANLVLTSCCAANGMCGVDASMFGMGCIDLATLASQPAGGFIMVPSPVACGDEDAGT